MNKIVVTLTASALLLMAASSASARASVEQGEGDWLPSFDLDNIADRAESLMNTITEQQSTAPPDVAAVAVCGLTLVLGRWTS